MTCEASRRTTIGALLTGSFAPLSALGSTIISSELARLIAKHDRLNMRLDAESDRGGNFMAHIDACGAARADIVLTPALTLPDILAKARCLGRAWEVADFELAAITNAARNYCYLDCMRDNLAADLIRYAEAQRCA